MQGMRRRRKHTCAPAGVACMFMPRGYSRLPREAAAQRSRPCSQSRGGRHAVKHRNHSHSNFLVSSACPTRRRSSMSACRTTSRPIRAFLPARASGATSGRLSTWAVRLRRPARRRCLPEGTEAQPRRRRLAPSRGRRAPKSLEGGFEAWRERRRPARADRQDAAAATRPDERSGSRARGPRSIASPAPG